MPVESYKFLKFFNGKGDPCNFSYDEATDKWTGRIDFGTVSEGLAESRSIFILEEFFNSAENRIDYCKPIFRIPEDGDTENPLKFIDAERVEEIFMFSSSSNTLIKQYDVLINLLQPIIFEGNPPSAGLHPLALDSEGRKIANPPLNLQNWNSEERQNRAMQLNFGFIPSSESGFSATLNWIDANGDVVLELFLYGEGEGEDERLRDILMSLGHDILPTDSIIFDSTDVNESNTDWKLINRKRKELLLEYQNIFPYVGSYKALINILKFYGYQNVRMKEYWKNVDLTSPNFGKYRQTNIIDLFSTEPDPQISSLIPSKIYKKTNLFGLFYDLNVETGEFDENGIPITEEVFTFTPEEVLIKIFALKRKLIQYYLPLNAKIVDIIGEALYFASYQIKTINSQNRIDSVSLGVKPTYEILPGNTGMIEDLRPLIGIKSIAGPEINAGSTSSNWVFTIGASGSGASNTIDDILLDLDFPSVEFTFRFSIPTTQDIIARFEIGIFDKRLWTAKEILQEVSNLINEGIQNPEVSNKYRSYVDGDLLKIIEINPGGPDEILFSINQISSIPPEEPVLIDFEVVQGVQESITIQNLLSSDYLGVTSSAYVGFFDPLNIDIINLNDSSNIPIGYPIKLKNTSFDLTWEDSDVTYGQVDSPEYQWNTIGMMGHFEMQWIVEKPEDETPAFVYDSGQKPIWQINEIDLILPYVGDYTVSLRLWDLYNTQSYIKDEKIITVRMPEADFIGWYSTRSKDYTWNDSIKLPQSDYVKNPLSSKTLTWDLYSSTWDLPFHPNESIEMLEISSNSLDSSEFYQTIENPIDNPYVDRFAYTWNLIGDLSTWDDAYHLWWNNIGTRVTEFEISSFGATGSTFGIIWSTEKNSGLDLYGGNLYFLESSVGWTGPTASGVGYTAGDITFIAPTKKTYVHNGSIFEVAFNTLDAIKISATGGISSAKASAIKVLQDLSSITESTNPVLSKFIYYYGERYESDYSLTPYIKAVSKEFESEGRQKLRYTNFDGDSETYRTPNFGYVGDIPAHFEICKIPATGPTGQFTINYLSDSVNGPTTYTYSIPAGITTLYDLANTLNGSTAQSLPLIGDFTYNLILGASGWTGGAGPTSYEDSKIQAISKSITHGQKISIGYTAGVIGTSYGRSLISNPDWNSIRVHKYSSEYPLLTTINFTYDNSKIKGKTNAIWHLKKEDDSSFVDIYYNNQYFSYMFNQRGSYTLELILEDSNGNRKTISKRETIKIV